MKSTTNPKDLAAAVSQSVYDSHRVVLRAIGAGAVNQAIKALAIARSYVALRGIDLAVRPGFVTVSVSNRPEMSAITLLVLVT